MSVGMIYDLRLWISQAARVCYFSFRPVLAHLKAAVRHMAVWDLLISRVKD